MPRHNSIAAWVGTGYFCSPMMPLNPARSACHLPLLLSLVFIGSLAFSCEEEQRVHIPADVIPQRKMEKILLGIHDAEARLIQSGMRQDTAMTVFLRMQADLYKEYKVDTGSVNRSLRFYTQHLDLLDSMYRRMEMRVK